MIRTPLKIVDFADHRQARGSMEHAECPHCEKVFAGASVVTSEPEATLFPSPISRHFVVYRTIYCDHCDCLVIWKQMSNIDGSRLGEKLGDYGTIRGRRVIDRFLKKHPEAAGVLQH